MALNALTDDTRYPYGFLPLSQEKILHVSPKRTALALKSPNSYPGKQPFVLDVSAGQAILTNQRLVYLPANCTPNFLSLSAPILNLQDTRVSLGLLSANSWVASLKTVLNAGINPPHQWVELRMTFNEGGVTEFHQAFGQVKEALWHAVDLARQRNQTGNIDMSTVHLDQLPKYSETPDTALHIPIHQPIPIAPGSEPNSMLRSNGRDLTSEDVPRSQPTISGRDQSFQPPDEPPPGYEESQASDMIDSLERRTSQPA